MRDEFLSEEDLDLRRMDMAELVAVWNAWLRQAQTTNDLDRDEYSHGVFMREAGREERAATGNEECKTKSAE